jgi:hypothetical protein
LAQTSQSVSRCAFECALPCAASRVSRSQGDRSAMSAFHSSSMDLQTSNVSENLSPYKCRFTNESDDSNSSNHQVPDRSNVSKSVEPLAAKPCYPSPDQVNTPYPIGDGVPTSMLETEDYDDANRRFCTRHHDPSEFREDRNASIYYGSEDDPNALLDFLSQDVPFSRQVSLRQAHRITRSKLTTTQALTCAR